jgi:hypothetical protein
MDGRGVLTAHARILDMNMAVIHLWRTVRRAPMHIITECMRLSVYSLTAVPSLNHIPQWLYQNFALLRC